MRITVKFGEKLQPKAETPTKKRPVKSNDLCLNRTHKTPISKEKTIPTIEERVRICPITPTEHSNVRPISIRRSPVIIVGTIMAKAETTREGRISLPEEVLL